MGMKYSGASSTRKHYLGGLILTRLNALLLCCSCAMACLLPHVETAIAGDASATQPAESDRAIEPWDLLRVTVSDLTNAGVSTEMLRRVDEHGKVSLPLVGAFKVHGSKSSAVAEEVVKIYHDAQLIGRTNCKVEIVERAASASIDPGPAAKGDHIEVRIWHLMRANEPTQEWQETCLVDGQGKISVPEIQAVVVAGLNDDSIEQAIIQAFRDAGTKHRIMVAVRRVGTSERRGAKSDK